MSSRALLITIVISFAAGCAGAPEGGTEVQPFNTGGGFGGTGGAGGIYHIPLGPPDICSVPEPGPIDLQTSWDGKTDLWGNKHGVIIVAEDYTHELGYLGIDPDLNILVFYGVSMTDEGNQLNAMPGTCRFPTQAPPPPILQVGAQSNSGKLPGTPPPSNGGGEKHYWTGHDCDELRDWAATALYDVQNGKCSY